MHLFHLLLIIFVELVTCVMIIITYVISYYLTFEWFLLINGQYLLSIDAMYFRWWIRENLTRQWQGKYIREINKLFNTLFSKNLKQLINLN